MTDTVDPSTNPIRLAVLVASARHGRLAPGIAEWAAERAGLHGGFTVDLIDLAQAALPDSLDSSAPQRQTIAPRLDQADAFLVVVPEYNRSFPGVLKTALDSFRLEWQAKPVGFVSYGLGMSGGLRAVEQLRLVFSELHAMCVRDSVALPRINESLTPDGRFNGNEGDQTGREQAAKLMLDQLLWWAQALRNHKSAHPYGR
ncbi:NADPH-dependent FMN reductase [Streptomyces sp. NPDC058326]|uniref:NADPH-dependent FMN reductase n=1 Tax=Streptomyces sp. NPDC058326 TaxID=3346447 RepID=UPI0036EDC78A